MGNDQSGYLGPEGKITVNVRAANDSEEFKVDLAGEIKQVVTETDIASFGLSTDKLKRMIKEFRNDKLMPDYLFFNSPAHVRGFVYTKPTIPCKKTLKPIKYAIKKKETETIVIGSRTLENRSQVNSTYTNNLTYTETNTIGTKWSSNIGAACGLRVDHMIVIPGSAELSFTSSYGEEQEKSTAVTIGSESGISVELAPGQKVVSKIRLIKHVYEIEIEYEASLSGCVSVVFDKSCYRENSYDIVFLMKTNGVKNITTFKEVIKMAYFTDGEVVLTDNAKRSGLMSYVFGK